jgi:hypothetical protein
MESIPAEILLAIAKFVIRDTYNYEMAIKILHSNALVSTRFNDVFNANEVWQDIALKFNDYTRLYRRRCATNLTWREVIQERLSNVFIEREILVGDRERPERRYLVQVHGNGNLFIGGNINMDRSILIHRFTDLARRFGGSGEMSDAIVCRNVSNELSPVEIDYIMMPYNMNLHEKVVDVSTYDPFMLILTDKGNVVEFIFKPSWDTKWDEFSRPRCIDFTNTVLGSKEHSSFETKKVSVDKIYAMDYAFMAIADGYIYTWSVIDNPLGGENIRTPPVRIDALSSIYVYFVEQNGLTTKLYYTPRTLIMDDHETYKFKSPFKEDIVDPDALFITIDNQQVMAIIAESVFTEEQIVEIAQRIRIAEE